MPQGQRISCNVFLCSSCLSPEVLLLTLSHSSIPVIYHQQHSPSLLQLEMIIVVPLRTILAKLVTVGYTQHMEMLPAHDYSGDVCVSSTLKF